MSNEKLLNIQNKVEKLPTKHIFKELYKRNKISIDSNIDTNSKIYERMVGIVDLINAHRSGITSKKDLSKFLEVSESFLEESIKYYSYKYGTFYKIDNYMIYFKPNLIIIEFF